MKSLLRSALVGAAALALLPACGGGGGAEADDAPEGETVELTTPKFVTRPVETMPATTAAPPGQVQPGDTTTEEMEYSVQSGEGICTVAAKFELDCQELSTYNELGDFLNVHLNPDDVLKIPAGATMPEEVADADAGDDEGDDESGDGTTDTSEAGDETTDTSEPEGSGEAACTHEIEAGENPSSVADDYGVTVDELRAANSDSNVMSTFLVGAELNIPAGGDC